MITFDYILKTNMVKKNIGVNDGAWRDYICHQLKVHLTPKFFLVANK